MISDLYLPLDALVPDLRNFNIHHEANVDTLVEQIAAVGFTAPFLVDAASKTIAAGHRRRLALLKMREAGGAPPEGVRDGWLVPCRVGDWDSLQRLKVLVGDNPDPARIEYSQEALTALLGELRDAGEMDGSGYDEGRLDELLAELTAGQEPEPPDDFPEYDEDIEVEHECPKCGYRFSGGQTHVSGAVDGGD